MGEIEAPQHTHLILNLSLIYILSTDAYIKCIYIYIHTHVYIYIDDIFEHWENLYLKHILDDIIELVLMS